MKKITFVLLCFNLFGFISNATAESVYQLAGNIYIHSKFGDITTQLTKSFHDSNPVLSPNEQWVAFLRKSRFPIPKTCHNYYDEKDRYGNEIWIYDLRKKKERLLVANDFSCNHLTKTIIDPADLKFSPDNKTLYFETSAWDTSGAIHSVKTDGSQLKFVTDGNEYRVVRNGKYKGDLIINQHKYHPRGGSYDWDWLYTPDGKQIKLYKKEG